MKLKRPCRASRKADNAIKKSGKRLPSRSGRPQAFFGMQTLYLLVAGRQARTL